ncbi:MAG: hypothetical protein F7C35_08770 [Desulfurococcales archaeon]|nr:hypothetical protein [Desulfurococcales archaeon]
MPRFLYKVMFDYRIIGIVFSFLIISFGFILYTNYMFSNNYIKTAAASACSGGSVSVGSVYSFGSDLVGDLSYFLRFVVLMYIVLGAVGYSILFYDSLDKRYVIYEVSEGRTLKGTLLRQLVSGVLLHVLASALFFVSFSVVFSVFLSGLSVFGWSLRVTGGFLALVVGVSLFSVGVGRGLAGSVVVAVILSFLLNVVQGMGGYSSVLDVYLLGSDALGPMGFELAQSSGVYPVWLLVLLLVLGGVTAYLRVELYEW